MTRMCDEKWKEEKEGNTTANGEHRGIDRERERSRDRAIERETER